MRKRLVKAVIFVAVAFGVAVGAASAAGAVDLQHAMSIDGSMWD